MHRLIRPVSGSFVALLAAPVVMVQPAPSAPPAPATSSALNGQKRIILHTRDGQAIPVGPPYSRIDRFDEPEGDNWIARLTIE